MTLRTRRFAPSLRSAQLVMAALTLAAATARLASAQSITIGAIGGVNRATLGGRDAGQYDARTGLIIGGSLSYAVSDPFAIQVQALYEQKGGNAPAVEGTGNVHLNYLEVPLLLKASLPNSRALPVRPYLVAGPAVAFKLKCELSADFDGSTQRIDCDDPLLGGEAKTKSVDVGMIFGAGADIRFGRAALALEVRYDLGLSTIDGTQHRTDVKNRVWSFLAGVSYPIGR